MVAFIQKAHGCIFLYDAIEAQEAQLAISDRPLPPRHRQAAAALMLSAATAQSERKKFTFYLELEKIQVDGGRNYYPTNFN